MKGIPQREQTEAISLAQLACGAGGMRHGAALLALRLGDVEERRQSHPSHFPYAAFAVTIRSLSATPHSTRRRRIFSCFDVRATASLSFVFSLRCDHHCQSACTDVTLMIAFARALDLSHSIRPAITIAITFTTAIALALLPGQLRLGDASHAPGLAHPAPTPPRAPWMTSHARRAHTVVRRVRLWCGARACREGWFYRGQVRAAHAGGYPQQWHRGSR